jgi:hypothetical protein
MSDKARLWLVAILVGGSLARLALGVGAATADSSPSGYHPHANHLGVVVTAHEVYVSWERVPGATTAAIAVRRGEPACPVNPGQGAATAHDSPMHAIDQSVAPGATYCYTVFLTRSDGTVTTVGSTGRVAVPTGGSVPPSHAPAPPPILTVSHGSSFDTNLAKRAGVGVAMAVAGLLALLLFLRGARGVSDGRMEMRPTMRESIVGRNSSALVVPTMIAVGWIVVVIGFVVLR